MKPASFEYLAPHSLEETLSILQEYGSDAKLLAGGQSLVPMMNFRLAQPRVLVDLNGLAGLDTISNQGGTGLRIGALTRQRRLETDPLIVGAVPVLAQAMFYVAHPQIRNRGTLGGSLAHADPAAELPVITVALGARFKLRSSRAERWVRAEDFFQGLFTTALQPDEVLVEVELTPIPPRTGWSFLEIAPRQGDYAMLGVAAMVTLDGQGVCQNARLVFLNAGDSPVAAREAARLLLGETPGESVIEAAAAMAANREIDPWGNVHTSPGYQRSLAQVLTRRALKQAAVDAAHQATNSQ